MHELAVTKSILDIVLRHAVANGVEKIMAVQLRVGELSDLEDEWMQNYFDYLSKETIAEGARLKIERTPVVVRCDNCSHEFRVNMKETKDIVCPECGGTKSQLLSGREYFIKNIEVI